ncbi:exocyst complex component Sec15 [Protomyces lactucae-debilis]|uniref:Exocyst complex component SEC15 n=1 Tax=Protomyces lactucae-debilis TaxID=2754530 RepID=A0A1Y2FSH5_PROLT|nr:exocyst complex component Sec15 [Protomyces lactucae-debilis]ORY86889.1 exocyst complex component Sec15 [Protomyces lactucae-debilis]
MLASQIQQVIGTSRSDNENLEQLAPLIRNACIHNQEDTLLGEIEQLARQKEAEIEETCNEHHNIFVASVEKLLRVRQGTSDLKAQVLSLNEELQDSGKALLERRKEVLETRIVRRNVDEACKAIEACLKVLNATNRIKELVEGKRFYAALRALDDLQRNRLKEVSGYQLTGLIERSIPTLKASIEDAVMAKLRAWMLDIREKSRLVGQCALEETLRRQQRWRDHTERNPSLKFARLHSPIELTLNEQGDFEPLHNDTVEVDLVPLFECMHLFGELGSAATFKRQYSEDRQTQKDLLLAPVAMHDMNAVQSLLHDVAGFTIIEHTIMAKTTPFRTKEDVDIIWQSLVASLVQSLKAAEHLDPAAILQMRTTMFTFIHTLEGYDLDLSPLNDFMLSLFEGYADALKRKFIVEFETIAEDDLYLPMRVNKVSDYKQIADILFFAPPVSVDSLTFPTMFPFSQIYPLACIELRNFIEEFHAYADELTRSDQVEELLRKSLDDLLVDSVNQILLSKLPKQRLEQVVQMNINLEYFEGACLELNRILNANSTKLQLSASEQFRITSKAAEKRIFELVNESVDQSLGTADYDWNTSFVQHEPSDYVQETVAFLRATSDSKLVHLPPQIKSFVYFDALDHLANELLQLFTSPSIRKMTEPAIENFSLDIRHLEDFVASLDDPVLETADHFGEIRQLIALVQSQRPSEMCDPATRQKKYGRVKINTAIQLLERLLSAIGYMPLDSATRARRQEIETALSGLRR